MTNFDYLKNEKDFDTFSDVAVTAERLYRVDVSSCVLAARRAAEFAVKWMYSVDKDLKMPYDDRFSTLVAAREFKEIVGADTIKRIDFIRTAGNNAAHTPKAITPEQAELALENLFYFLDEVAYLYAEEYEERDFDSELLKQQDEPAQQKTFPDIDIEKLIAENAALKEQLTEKRKEQAPTYSPKPLDISEYETRRVYIDTMLIDAGWTLGRDWVNEYPLEGMPNKSEQGFADYVLFGNDGKPLAVIEAKRACKDIAVGRQQAKLYADLLEQKFGRRPVIFLTNGFDTHIWNDLYYPERAVSGIYSKRDLEKEFNKMLARTKLDNVHVNSDIAGRYYQKEAVKAVCHAFGAENARKALLVMATGSGKTRTVIALVEALINNGWVKNVLFLADRNSLVTQAKRAFVNLLPDLSVVNLCEDKENYGARGVFSTYQTMMNCIDSAKDEDGGKLFTVGHFDLIICDEAHRSIYNKYRDIFTYFEMCAMMKNKYGTEVFPNRLTRDLVQHTYEMRSYGVEFSHNRSNGQRLLSLKYDPESDGSDGKILMTGGLNSTDPTVPVVAAESPQTLSQIETTAVTVDSTQSKVTDPVGEVTDECCHIYRKRSRCAFADCDEVHYLSLRKPT